MMLAALINSATQLLATSNARTRSHLSSRIIIAFLFSLSSHFICPKHIDEAISSTSGSIMIDFSKRHCGILLRLKKKKLTQLLSYSSAYLFTLIYLNMVKIVTEPCRKLSMKLLYNINRNPNMMRYYKLGLISLKEKNTYNKHCAYQSKTLATAFLSCLYIL
jgi:hypothetical protein